MKVYIYIGVINKKLIKIKLYLIYIYGIKKDL